MNLALLSWWQRQRLTSRLVFSSVSLVLALLLLLFALVQGLISQQADRQWAHELHAAERVWRSLLAQESSRLLDSAALLASNHELRRALGRKDLAQMETALALEGERIGAQITAVLDTDLQLQATKPLDAVFLLWLKHTAYPQMARAQNGRTPADTPSASPWIDDPDALSQLLRTVAEHGTRDRSRSVLALLGDAPYQFVVAPVLDQEHNRIQGWVLMGFALSQSLADQVHTNLDVHVVLFADAAHNPNPPTLVFSTLATPASGLVLQADAAYATYVGNRYAQRQLRLPTLGGELHTVLLRSVSDAELPFVQLQLWLGGLSLLGLALFAWASARSVRRITAPLATLQQAALALEQGRFDAPLPPSVGFDEVSQLSRGFDAMRQSLAEQQGEIRRLAYRDRLTGLPNRQRFVEAVELALGQQRAGQPPLSVLSLNLDRFKHVNEVMGYAFGDELLRAVAQRLSEAVGKGHLLARLGSDEFGFLLTGLSADQALTQARLILAQLAAGVVLGGQRVDVRASAGLAEGPRDGSDADALINHAEMAMRQAKRRTAGVLCFVPEHDRSQVADLSLLGAMRDGMVRGELRMYLQPKLPLQSTRALAAEALLRWQHPTEGLIAPVRFIPFAEQTGFITELTTWVIDAAAQACAQWQQLGFACPIAVNVSTRDLLDPAFAERVAACLRRHGVDSSQISLEITESALMEDPARALSTLQQLAALGLELAIDDYGTGYSSLTYLKQLPVQTLKIDQSFIAQMASDSRDAAIVQSSLELAHQLGLLVVAEGVEDAATLQRLQAWGCDWAQGYHIAKPMPWEQLAPWWAKQPSAT